MTVLLALAAIWLAWVVVVYLALRAAKKADPYAGLPKGNGHLPAETRHSQEPKP